MKHQSTNALESAKEAEALAEGFSSEEEILPLDLAFQNCLKGVQRLLIKHSIPTSSVFMAYAFEDEYNSTAELKNFLQSLDRDLGCIGIVVSWDREGMSRDEDGWSHSGFEESEYYFLIGSSAYKAQSRVCDTGVASEYRKILEKFNPMTALSSERVLIPIQYEGTFAEAFPEGTSEALVHDFRAQSNYSLNFLRLIPMLYPIFNSDGALNRHYLQLVGNFWKACLKSQTQAFQERTLRSYPMSRSISEPIFKISEKALDIFKSAQSVSKESTLSPQKKGKCLWWFSSKEQERSTKSSVVKGKDRLTSHKGHSCCLL